MIIELAIAAGIILSFVLAVSIHTVGKMSKPERWGVARLFAIINVLASLGFIFLMVAAK